MCIYILFWGQYSIHKDSHAKHLCKQNKVLVYVVSKEFNFLEFNPSYPAHPKTFGQMLRKQRMDKGLLIKELAKIVGVSPDTIINWEIRNVKPIGKNLEKVRDFLDA